MKVATLVVIALVACSVLCQSPVAKAWANQWQSDFTEKMILAGSGTSTGKWYYDWTNKQFRVDRVNGKFDRYCGVGWYIFRNAKCNQYVVNGWRYLHYPEKNYCCKCCHASNGCGIVTPTWFQSGAYTGKKSVDSVQVNEWNAKGLQDNIYAEVVDTRIPKRIYQAPQSDMVFDHNSYSEQINPAVFTLPPKCDSLCPAISICGAARREKME